jgi:DNA repair exonuclease SbcCD ATPase subunit
MSLKVRFEKGDTIDQSFFIGSSEIDGKTEEVVVRASHLLHPTLVNSINKIAASDATPEEKEAQLNALPVKEEEYIKQLESLCPDLETFRQLAIEAGVDNLKVKAASAKMAEEPTQATEDLEKVKVENEPKMAAEAPLASGGEPSKESAPDMKKYLARLPNRSFGDPEQAIDVNSAIQALAEELEKKDKEIGDLNKKISDKEKGDDLKSIKDKLATCKVSKENIAKLEKRLAEADDKCLGLIDEVLDVMEETCEGEGKGAAGGKTFPPKAAPAFPPKKPAPVGGSPFPPEMSAKANVVHSAIDETVGEIAQVFGAQNSPSKLADLWMAKDRVKESYRSR